VKVSSSDCIGSKFASCRLCGDFFQLCPPKKNLQANLMNHLEGLKHSKLVVDCSNSTRSNSSALSTRRRGRPSKSAGTVQNQANLHGWFKRIGDASLEGEHLTFVSRSCVGGIGANNVLMLRNHTPCKVCSKTLVPVSIGSRNPMLWQM
jgi:hypothetical protein